MRQRCERTKDEEDVKRRGKGYLVEDESKEVESPMQTPPPKTQVAQVATMVRRTRESSSGHSWQDAASGVTVESAHVVYLPIQTSQLF